MAEYTNYEKLKLVENGNSIKKAYASDCNIKKIKGTEYHVPLPTLYLWFIIIKSICVIRNDRSCASIIRFDAKNCRSGVMAKM